MAGWPWASEITPSAVTAIMVMPVASPSRPSIRFMALVIATTQTTVATRLKATPTGLPTIAPSKKRN